MGATVVVIDVDDAKLAAMGKVAALALNARAYDQKALRAAVQAFAKEKNLPQTEWFIFECSGTARGRDGLRPSDAWRHALRRRLHHGQGGNPPLEPDGVPRPGAGQLGLPAGTLPGRARPGARRQASISSPSSSSTRCNKSTTSSHAAHAGEMTRRRGARPRLI
jgi:hypothetical protein